MNLFAYGTLMFPQVWEAVVGREFESVPATLPGYRIYRVEGATFPGIIASAAGESVPGLVYRGLDAEAMAALDAFEDDFYLREAVAVLTEPDGIPLPCNAYVVPLERRDVLSEDVWTASWFAEHGLAEFVGRRRDHAPVPGEPFPS